MSSTGVRRSRRVLATGGAVLLLIPALLIAYCYVSAVTEDRRDFDRATARRIRSVCGRRDHCILILSQVIPGGWDTLVEFGPGSSRADMTTYLQSRFRTALPASDIDKDVQNAIVLLREGKVTSVQYSDEGVESSLADSVGFGCYPREDNIVSCRADARVEVVVGQTDGDPARGFTVSGPTYYLKELR